MKIRWFYNTDTQAFDGRWHHCSNPVLQQKIGDGEWEDVESVYDELPEDDK